MKKQSEIKVQVLLFKEGQTWVAQCLEHDLAAQGQTLKQAKESLNQVFITQVVLDLDAKREPFSAVQRAPQFYWDRLREIKHKKQQDKLKLSLDGFLRALNITTNSLEYV